MVFQFVQQKSEKVDYLVGGAWGLYTKAIKEFKIAKSLGDEKKMEKLSKKIKTLEETLGLKKGFDC